jgi:hypothetical protein
MPPHDRPTTQVGATMEVAPERKEEETTWDIITSLRQIEALGAKKDYRDPA